MYFPGLALGLLLPRTSCVTSDKVLSHATPQHPQLYSEHKDTCVTGLIREWWNNTVGTASLVECPAPGAHWSARLLLLSLLLIFVVVAMVCFDIRRMVSDRILPYYPESTRGRQPPALPIEENYSCDHYLFWSFRGNTGRSGNDYLV